MNTIDIVITVILLFGLIKGFLKGLFVEITTLVGLVLGVYGAIQFSYFFADLLKDKVNWDASMIQVVAFSGTFLVILLALVFLGKALTKIAESAALGVFNKILGGLFGFLKYALILSVIFLVYDKMNRSIRFIDQKKARESVLFDPVKKFAPTIFPSIVEVVEKTNTK